WLCRAVASPGGGAGQAQTQGHPCRRYRSSCRSKECHCDDPNFTGITPYVSGLPAKQLELAREIVPGARRIGVLNDINDPKGPPQWEELQAAGRLLEVSVTATEVRSPDDLVKAIQGLREQQPDAIIVLQTSMLLSERQKIAALANAIANDLWIS